MSFLIPNILGIKDQYRSITTNVNNFCIGVSQLNNTAIETMRNVNEHHYNFEYLKQLSNEIISMVIPIYYNVIAFSIFFILIKNVVAIELYVNTALAMLFGFLFFIDEVNRDRFIKHLVIYIVFFILVKLSIQLLVFLIMV